MNAEERINIGHTISHFYFYFILVFLANIPIDLILANGLQSVNLTQIYDARIKE